MNPLKNIIAFTKSATEQFASAIAQFVNRHPVLFLVCFTAAYAVLTCRQALNKPLWYDELCTYYVSKLPSVSDIWAILETGFEQLPPGIHLAMRASHFMFGENLISTRLPAIIGFWLMCVCCFFFVARRTAPVYGAVAAVFPLLTDAYFYAYEGRPYGLVLGGCGVALLSWQFAVEGKYRRVTLPGLAAGLAIAVSSHYYAILFLVPLSLGELIRFLKSRRLDIPLWATVAAGVTPLLLFIPLVQGSWNRVGQPLTGAPSFSGLFGMYSKLIHPAMLCLSVLLVVAAAIRIRTLRLPTIADSAEFGVLVAICALPIFLRMGGSLTGHASPRYVLQTILGVSILVAFSLAKGFGRGAPAAAILVLTMMALLPHQARRLRFLWDADPLTFRLENFKSMRLEELPSEPIVVAAPTTYLPLWHVSEHRLRSRLYFLTEIDTRQGLEIARTQALDSDMRDLARVIGISVSQCTKFTKDNARFFVVGERGQRSCSLLLAQIIRDGGVVELRRVDEVGFLFEVMMNPVDGP
jgi:hypothetical protein